MVNKIQNSTKSTAVLIALRLLKSFSVYGNIMSWSTNIQYFGIILDILSFLT